MSAFSLPDAAAMPLVGRDGAATTLSSTDGVIGLYFSASWCGPCRRFTPQLRAKLTELKAAGNKIDIILVSADEDAESAAEYFKHSELDYMLSFDSAALNEELNTGLHIEGIPSLALFDGTTSKLITTDGREALFETSFDKLQSWAEDKAQAEAEAAKKKAEAIASFSFANVFGDNIIDGNGAVVPPSEMSKNDIVGLYFSAHWCPPCRGFTPILAAKYTELRAAGKTLEIVFVSSDRSEEEAKEYFGSHPWKMLGFSQRETKTLLSEIFNVEGIPTLVLLTGQGKLITDDGRSALFECPFERLDHWEEEKAKAEAIKAAEIAATREHFDVIKVFPEGSIVDADGAAVSSARIVADTEVLGIFLAGSWDDDSTAFLPELSAAYSKFFLADKKKLDIVYIGLDRSAEDSKAFFNGQPWAKRIDYNNREKAQFFCELFEVRAIPFLVLVDVKTGKVLSKDGAARIAAGATWEDFVQGGGAAASPATVFSAAVSST